MQPCIFWGLCVFFFLKERGLEAMSLNLSWKTLFWDARCDTLEMKDATEAFSFQVFYQSNSFMFWKIWVVMIHFVRYKFAVIRAMHSSRYRIDGYFLRNNKNQIVGVLQRLYNDIIESLLILLYDTINYTFYNYII